MLWLGELQQRLAAPEKRPKQDSCNEAYISDEGYLVRAATRCESTAAPAGCAALRHSGRGGYCGHERSSCAALER